MCAYPVCFEKAKKVTNSVSIYKISSPTICTTTTYDVLLLQRKALQYYIYLTEKCHWFAKSNQDLMHKYGWKYSASCKSPPAIITWLSSSEGRRSNGDVLLSHRFELSRRSLWGPGGRASGFLPWAGAKWREQISERTGWASPCHHLFTPKVHFQPLIIVLF